MKRIAAGILCLALAAPALAASEKPSEETLAWCREHNVVCLSPSEYREVAIKIIMLERDQKIANARTGGRRFGALWATAGVEYLPNDGTWHPYGIGGVRIKRISLWGGFFGETPAAGVGLSW